MKKMILALALSIPVAFGGCASMSSQEKADTKTLVIAKCPVLKQYTKEQLIKAAQELKSLPSESQLAILLTDYGKLRDACRIISKQLKKQK